MITMSAKIVEEWHNKNIETSTEMERAIRHTINMIGPGWLPCLVCNDPTTSRGIYIPLDHNEDVGAGPHFENLTRIYSFALCGNCTQAAAFDERAVVRGKLKEAVMESRANNPETIM